MTKKNISIISHKRKISRVRNKVTRKTFKKTKKGKTFKKTKKSKTFKKTQYGGYNVEIVQEKIEEWNKELKKKCPTLELKFDYQENMMVNAIKKEAKIVSLKYKDKYILCLFNEEDCISSISFDFNYNETTGKYYVEINSVTQEDMKKKKYNKFLRATLIKLLYIFFKKGNKANKVDIKAEYIYSEAVNPISLLNLLPYKIDIRNWEVILPFFEKIARENKDNLPSTYNHKKSENLKALLKEFIKNQQDYMIKEIHRETKKIEMEYILKEEKKEPIDKKQNEINTTAKVFRIEINKIQKNIAKHTAGEKSKGTNLSGLKEKLKIIKKKMLNIRIKLGKEVRELINERNQEIEKIVEKELEPLPEKPPYFPYVHIFLNIEQNIDAAKAIWNKLLSKLDESESIKCP